MDGWMDGWNDGFLGAVRCCGRFPNLDPLGSDCTTRGVRIRANALWVPEQSYPSNRKYFFAYRVRISYDPEPEDHRARNPAFRCQLTLRHWMVGRFGVWCDVLIFCLVFV